MTYRQVYQEGTARLAEQSIEDAQLDARLLLEEVCHTNRNDLLAHGDREVDSLHYDIYMSYIEKRAQHIPYQQLIHQQEFMGLTFYVNEHVLIPRQDTETLVEEVMREMQDGMSLLDMCTGSGCILLSLMHYSNGCSGTGADLSADALAVARRNGEDLGIDAHWIQSNLFEQITGTYDRLISNPPYINSDVIDTLMPEVKEHEPMMALDGGVDGLRFYREIIQKAPEYLNPEGMLYFEIGYDQGEAVSGLMKQQGFTEVRVVKDLAGMDRVVCGRRP